MTQNKKGDKQSKQYRKERNWPSKPEWIGRMGNLNSVLSYQVGDFVEEAFCDGFDAAEKQYLGEIQELKEHKKWLLKAIAKRNSGLRFMYKTSGQQDLEIESLKADLADRLEQAKKWHSRARDYESELADKDITIQVISKNTLEMEKDLESAVLVMEKAVFVLQCMIIKYNGPCPGLTPEQVFDGACDARDYAKETLINLKSKLGRGKM